MKKILKMAEKESEHAEIFSIKTSSDSIKYENTQLKDIDTRIQSGVSLRIIKDGKLGFSYTKNLTDREKLVENALHSLKGGVNVSYEFPHTEDVPELDTYDTSIESLKNSDILQECEKINNKLESETKGQINLQSLRQIKEIRILNSSGTDLKFKSSLYFINTSILYPGSYSAIQRSLISRSFQESPDEYLNYLLKMFNKAYNEVEVKTGKMKVLFLPESVYVLLWRLISATNGRSIFQKESPLTDKIGSKIFNQKLNIYNEPLNDDTAGARAFDDEGTSCRKLTLIEDGVLKNFYYDLNYAEKLNKSSTGNGFRSSTWGGESVSTRPAPSLLHLIIESGSKTLDEMISSMDRGIIVAGALGAHSGNIPNGDFSIGLSPGLYVENGEIRGRVKDAMVSGNIYNVLKNVISIENKVYNTAFFGLRVPAILLDEVNISTQK